MDRLFPPPTPDSSKGMRLMGIFAHPDDEISGVLPRVTKDGGTTFVITMTDGREAESFDPSVPSRPDVMAAARVPEWNASLSALGVAPNHRVQMGYHDSGMKDSPTSQAPGALWCEPMDNVVQRLVQQIRAFRPQVILTNGNPGAYGHPDHIKTFAGVQEAFERAADPQYHPELGRPFAVSKLYTGTVPPALSREIRIEARAEGRVDPADHSQPQWAMYLPSDNDFGHTVIDARDVAPQVLGAMASQRTQMPPGFFLRDATTATWRKWAVEHLRLERTRVAVPQRTMQRRGHSVALPETDIFSGVRGHLAPSTAAHGLG